MFSIDLTKRYGILLSGGLDSAVLLYLLISNEPKIRLQPFTIAKSDGAAMYADPVIEFLNKKFNVSIPKTIFVGDPTAHHRMQSTTAVSQILGKELVDYIYIGINKIPEELRNYPGAPKRDSASTDSRILVPFVKMTKDQILEIMINNGQEELSNITHSCTEQQEGRCNLCWQCTERAWAFSKLGIVDTGTR